MTNKRKKNNNSSPPPNNPLQGPWNNTTSNKKKNNSEVSWPGVQPNKPLNISPIIFTSFLFILKPYLYLNFWDCFSSTWYSRLRKVFMPKQKKMSQGRFACHLKKCMIFLMWGDLYVKRRKSKKPNRNISHHVKRNR